MRVNGWWAQGTRCLRESLGNRVKGLSGLWGLGGVRGLLISLS